MGYYEELPELDINEGLEDMKIYKNAVLVDVRTPEEYAEGHVPGAINLEAALCGRKNRAYVESVLPDKTAHVCMYCYSGARSGMAAAFLVESVLPDKTAHVCMYCYSGARSGMAAAFLRQMGYDRAENIGGYEGYEGPVEI